MMTASSAGAGVTTGAATGKISAWWSGRFMATSATGCTGFGAIATGAGAGVGAGVGAGSADGAAFGHSSGAATAATITAATGNVQSGTRRFLVTAAGSG
ncbi:hypothetical protein D3C78_1603080 [compost metagenome]